MVAQDPRQGIKNLVIVSPAFLADGLETLEELNMEIREQFMEAGGEEMHLVRCLNDNPDWIDGLADLVRSALNV